MEEGHYRLIREGLARVQTRIQSSQAGVLAGSRVLVGQVSKDSYVRVARNRRVLWTGRIRELEGFAKAGRPASAGQNCTIAFDGFEAFQVGDSIEAFQLKPSRDR